LLCRVSRPRVWRSSHLPCVSRLTPHASESRPDLARPDRPVWPCGVSHVSRLMPGATRCPREYSGRPCRACAVCRVPCADLDDRASALSVWTRHVWTWPVRTRLASKQVQPERARDSRPIQACYAVCHHASVRRTYLHDCMLVHTTDSRLMTPFFIRIGIGVSAGLLSGL
jgi:hypothetical protein